VKRLLAVTLCLASALLWIAPNVSGNGMTLEQLLSSPFPSELIATKNGDKVAWIFYNQGKRNLWIAEAPLFAGRRLTAYTKDDGQELGDPVFSDDGNWIAFVRGGPPNSDHENPNPSTNPEGAKEEVWCVSVSTGALRRIGEGSAPLFSPKGDRVIYVNDGHLWSAPTVVSPVDRAAAKPQKMFEIRGQVSSPRWSPDGSLLAFVSSRRDHSFITIYDKRAVTLRYLDASIDRDIAPRWSPDGKRLAFIRLYNVTDTLSPDHERLLPWAIRVVDVASGKAKDVWRSGKTETDSFSQLPVGENLLQWAGGERLVFASEKDGWAHMYSVSTEGGTETLLTPGDYEIENVAWSPDRTYFVAASNASDIDHRHLWKVSVAGGKPSQLTRGDGIEMYPVVVDGGRRMAFLRSTARDPLLPEIASIDGSNMKPLAKEFPPAGFPSDQLVEPESVVIDSADGVKVHCQLFKPKNGSGKAPAMVFMHGGPIRQMLLGWHYGFYYHNAYALNQYLVSRGFVVLSVNYRCGIGYGRAFREAKHRGPRGASEYQDIVAAGRYLRTRSDVDGHRIGLWGGSYGGFLTAMGLARNSDIFAAGVDIHGVHDWSARVGPSPWATGDLAKLGKESSPISSADKWRSPVLFIHGDDDRNVQFSQTVELARKLRDRGVEFEELVLPDEIHDFLRHESWLRVYHAAADFLERRLRE